MKINNSILTLLALALTVVAIPGTSHAAVNVGVGFLNPRMQVFVVGDILDGAAIEEGGDIDLDDFTEFFYLKLNGTPDAMDTKIYIKLAEDLGNDRLINYVTSSDPDEAFTLRQWINASAGGDGNFSNTDLSRIETSDWFTRDHDQTTFADVTTVLENIENGLFPTSTFTLSIEVYDLSNTLLGSLNRTIKVFNPGKPILSQPADFSTPANLNSIQFSWTWPSGGPTLSSDWQLVIVDAGTEKPSDPESVITDRTPASTRYEGSPSTSTGHNYTGTGGETELPRNRWYCWQVKVNAPATLRNSTRPYESDVRAFSTIPDLTQIQGYSSILYNALMIEGGDLRWVMEDIKSQFEGFVPTVVKKGKDGTDMGDQAAVDEIKTKKTGNSHSTEVVQ